MSEISQALTQLKRSRLERDDETDPDGRIYRDSSGTVYYSVTRILSATASDEKKAALARWLERPTSIQDREIAATRGTLTHDAAEFMLRTARKLAFTTAKKKRVLKESSDGLERPPSAITTWALKKALDGAPKPSWSAAGYTRGLRAWIAENVKAIHAIEFSIHHHELFYAGTADFLGDIAIQGEDKPILSVCDWKTSQSKNPPWHDYSVQAAAYAIGLERLTGLKVPGAHIVIARRTGSPIVHEMDSDDLKAAGFEWRDRVPRFLDERETLERSAA